MPTRARGGGVAVLCACLDTACTLHLSNLVYNAQFQSDVKKRVRDLDAQFPGSTFERVLNSYGADGKYLVLVDGPF